MQRCAALAALYECSTFKPGNISPYYEGTTTYFHYLASSIAVAEGIAEAERLRLGECILNTVKKMLSAQGGGNTQLGIVLLFAPLAKAAFLGLENLRAHLKRVLASTTVEDAVLTCRAIRMANPGKLPPVERLDVFSPNIEEELRENNVSLTEWMRVGAENNTVCKEYVTGYALTFDTGYEKLHQYLREGKSLRDAVLGLYLTFLSQHVDTMVLGEHGREIAEEVQRRAQVLIEGNIKEEDIRRYHEWMIAKGINPGTSADLVASSLFVFLLEEEGTER